jgi:hypothetical protein
MDQIEIAKRKMRETFEDDAEAFPPYKLLLAYGEDFEPRLRPDDIPVGEKKYCYRNAYRLACERPNLRYIEGFGVSRDFEGMPNRHAWCADSEGRVFDPTPTWADPDRPLTVLALCGIGLPLDFVCSYVDREELHCGTLYELSDEIHLITDELGLDRLR